MDTPRENALEDRLRGLILNNVDTRTNQTREKQNETTQHLPSGAHWQQEAQRSPRNAQQASQNAQRRPNQAQRRQMTSEMNAMMQPRPQNSPYMGRGYNFDPASPRDQRAFGHRNQESSYQQTPASRPYLNHDSSRTPFAGDSHRQNQPRQDHWNQNGSRMHVPYGAQERASRGSWQTNSHEQAFTSRPNPHNPHFTQHQAHAHRNNGGYDYDLAAAQSAYLEGLATAHVSQVQVEPVEFADKETFREIIEKACREHIVRHAEKNLGVKVFPAESIQLKCFGSMSSGFATRGSDMDLALLSPNSAPAVDSPESPIPRLVEQVLLDMGYGARLLTRTRVPIIKVCEQPPEDLLAALREERRKWEQGSLQVEDNEKQDAEDFGSDPEDAHDSIETTKDTAVEKDNVNVGDRIENSNRPSHERLLKHYNLATRRLRRLGGVDFNSGKTLSSEDCQNLNHVCRVLVKNIEPKELSIAVKSFPSVAPLFKPGHPIYHWSLSTIWAQIEGENLRMAWTRRRIHEATEQYEKDLSDAITAWEKLQNELPPANMLKEFETELLALLGRLKRAKSLQVALLEQLSHEDASQYSQRSERILHALTAKRSRDLEAWEECYVQGIRDSKTRHKFQSLKAKRHGFQAMTFHHRLYELAADYEYACKHSSLYERSDHPAIMQYCEYLRSLIDEDPMFTGLSGDPVTQQATARMLSMPDPTTVSPRKPREKKYNPRLEFPETSGGVQCDINFSADLALHNTLLLRCYSHCDLRVKPMVLFIKHWAKTRDINTPYRGTLSSYGYVLMVLHYLVNIASPFVCPNLQLVRRTENSTLNRAATDANPDRTCHGRDVQFWSDEGEIRTLCARGELTRNKESVGALLRGFFEYYAQSGPMSSGMGRGFDWGRQVLSLRTLRGTLTKQDKGWVGARTEFETIVTAAPPQPRTRDFEAVGDAGTRSTSEKAHDAEQIKTVEETKEIKHRYLFAIEDPFELDHNVARTVTHTGIVAIRDELRRAWRIIQSVNHSGQVRDSRGLLDMPNRKESDSQVHAANGWRDLMKVLNGEKSI